MLGSVLKNSEVYLGAYSECTWERLESLLGSVQSCRLAVGSVLESMPGSVLGNVLGGVLGSVLGVYLGAS